MARHLDDPRPLSFQTVREVNGDIYEHLHTTFVECLGDTWIVDEHVLVNGELTTVRVEIPAPDEFGDASRPAS